MSAAASPPSRGRAFAGYALVALAATQWGMWPLILRPAEAIAPMAPALESTIMMTVLTLVSAPFSLRDRVPKKATAAQWCGVAWLGFADAMNVLLFFAAYQTTNVAIAVLTHYLAPIFVAITAPIFLKERPSVRAYVAVVLSFVGLVLLLAPWNAQGRPTDVLGAALGAGSAVFYASNVLVTKRLTPAFSGSELMFFHGLVSVPILALCVPHDAWLHLHPRAISYVALGSIGPGAFGGLFFVWGLRRVAASHASTLTLLEPLVAVLVAAVAFHERLGPAALAGGVLIMLGAGLVVSKPQA